MNFANSLLGLDNVLFDSKTSRTRICVNLGLFWTIFSPTDFVQVKAVAPGGIVSLTNCLTEAPECCYLAAGRFLQAVRLHSAARMLKTEFDDDEVLNLHRPGAQG